jgi:hypothetical protein
MHAGGRSQQGSPNVYYIFRGSAAYNYAFGPICQCQPQADSFEKVGLWLAFYQSMFLKNIDLIVLKSALIPHLFPHFFVIFARHLTGFFSIPRMPFFRCARE